MGEETECNVDDVMCQMMALSHLKGLKSVLGEEKYRAEFPELQSLDGKIASREASLRETLGRCGLPVLTGTELVEGTPEEREEE
ncbi:hypothetical protein LCGC14_0654970 [marine sediment metagenome]|uniref:Uncharacterized protein n=1 Tax=marine sediment metagenome TaxID=412755 RepID=A0A0F9QVB2_9ZZZZ